MELHPDFRDLLAEFVREKVEFVLIGGYAVGRYTKPRATKDLDLLVAGSALNLDRVSTCSAATKRASGRPQDLADLALLEKVRG